MKWLELPITCWVRVGRVDILAWSIILERKGRSFTIKFKVSYGIFIDDFLSSCSNSPLFWTCWKFWIQTGIGFCQKFFMCQLIWSYDFWLFSLLIWWISLIDFWMLNQPWIPGINPILFWYIILVYFSKFSLLIFCWRVLCLSAWEILIYCFLFWYCFWYQGNTNFIKQIESVSFSTIFWRNYVDLVFSLNVW